MDVLRSVSVRLVFASLIVLCAQRARADELFPFVLPWDDSSPGITNLSGLLDKPAGAGGFVSAKDGHLFASDKRFRIFGVNVAFGGNFPTHDDAGKVAARMAKFGINCVRFHHMDTGTAPSGLLQKDRRTLDPEALDRLDYFIAQLKKNGVYADINLHVGNPYPGMVKWEGASSYFKGVDNFYPPMIEEQHAYARALLGHLNPYAQLTYAAEPAVAFIEINNENGLIMEWNNKSLDAMPDPYAAELGRQWNDWLRKRYGDGAKLADAWKEGEQPLGEEMWSRGSKSGDGSAWNFETHEAAKAEIQVKSEANVELVEVRVTTPGTEPWHVQFNRAGLKLQGGKTYTVAFRAKASRARKIAVNLGQSHDPWKVLATQEVKLTPEWQSCKLALIPSAAEDNARLSFSGFASETGEVTFENITLRPGGVLALQAGEELGGIPFFKKAAIGERTLAAQRDWNRFLYDTEAHYWPEMARFIKEDLGARSLVFGTATGFSPWPIQALLDVVDAHAYWQHPHFPHRDWDMNDWTVKNESMAGAADGGTLPKLALQRVAGKPFVVTEYNHASPNTFSGEAFLEVCAVAALQDWDGVFAFAYSHRQDEWDLRRIPSFFDIDQHPTKMATLPAALALFYRADVQPPGPPVVAVSTLDDLIESVRKGSSWISGKDLGFRPEEAFMHPIAMRIGEQTHPAAGGKVTEEIIRSANGQVTWDRAAHRMLIATPRSVGVIGNIKSGEVIELGGIKIIPGATRQNWATITVTVMSGESIAGAKSLLITATGYAENTEMGWKNKEKTTVGANWGKAPSMVEGIPLTVSLPASAPLHAWALDELGHRKTEVPVRESAGAAELKLGPERKTLWWEVSAGN